MWRKKVNCHFCCKDTRYPGKYEKGWICPNCSQYNGFDKHGNYNIDIVNKLSPKRSNKKPKYCKYGPNPFKIHNIYDTISLNKSTLLPTKSNAVLCDLCNKNQNIIQSLLQSFDPKPNSNYDVYLKYRNELEKKYPLCNDCGEHNQLSLHAINHNANVWQRHQNSLPKQIDTNYFKKINPSPIIKNKLFKRVKHGYNRTHENKYRNNYSLCITYIINFILICISTQISLNGLQLLCFNSTNDKSQCQSNLGWNLNDGFYVKNECTNYGTNDMNNIKNIKLLCIISSNIKTVSIIPYYIYQYFTFNYIKNKEFDNDYNTLVNSDQFLQILLWFILICQTYRLYNNGYYFKKISYLFIIVSSILWYKCVIEFGLSLYFDELNNVSVYLQIMIVFVCALFLIGPQKKIINHNNSQYRIKNVSKTPTLNKSNDFLNQNFAYNSMVAKELRNKVDNYGVNKPVNSVVFGRPNHVQSNFKNSSKGIKNSARNGYKNMSKNGMQYNIQNSVTNDIEKVSKNVLKNNSYLSNKGADMDSKINKYTSNNDVYNFEMEYKMDYCKNLTDVRQRINSLRIG